MMLELFNLLDKNNYDNNVIICNSEDLFSFFTVQLNSLEKNIIIVTPSIYDASKIYNTLSSLSNNVYSFFADDFISNESLTASPELKFLRLETVSEIINSEQNILVTNIDALLRFMPSKDLFKKHIYRLKKGDTISRDELFSRLINSGYNRESTVTKTGEVALRGYVIDVYPLTSEDAIRIEFFDDEIDSIRIFDPETQISTKEIMEIEVFPNTDFFNSDNILKNKFMTKYIDPVSIASYLEDPLIIFKDYSAIVEVYKREIEQTLEYEDPDDYDGRYFLDLNDIKFRKAHYNSLEDAPYYRDYDLVKINSNNVAQFNDNTELLNAYLAKSVAEGKTVILCLNDKQIKSVSKYLTINHYINTKVDKTGVYLIDAHLENGFEYNNFIFLSAFNLFKRVSVKSFKSRFKYARKITDPSQINIGDYVVHDLHGIGVYEGIKSLEQNGILKDYLDIRYFGTDRLYIPADKMDLIAKYSGKEGLVPRLSSLGGRTWQKTKERVTMKARKMASDLIRLYAERKLQKGFSFSDEDELEQEFDEQFEYPETPDQRRSTREIKRDMESASPMDRLLCGDVGYGKTEVAFKAMFKAVKDAKQVMYLCPTTILSSQQYDSATERFKTVPARIELLNRFTPTKKKREIISDFNNGFIDILIGTHRILSNDIKAKDLGLLVIDEEQRFGVTHKEKIKKYKTSVDVLTLSATPIPRTLQMSLMGIRGLSLIETPPKHRYPVQTYVIRENDLLIKDAIYKELARGGQVFILYNRVKSIETKYQEIKSMVPSARIVVAHGQLGKNDLENRMIDFTDGLYDVMICTTIIETGIDIPNVNTLIIYEADRFGLSQLYQIRGRVGRGDKIAYAYLLYSGGKVLTEEATKRLKAIKEFTELGSGFKIASRDLAIRGAGDILGEEQAGYIDQVGIDLYLKILNEEIKRLKNGPEELPEEVPEKEISIKNVSTHISDKYTDDEDIKILIHKMISDIKTKNDLNIVKESINDRFGAVSEEVEIYMLKEYFEKNALQKGIHKIVEKKNEVEIYFNRKQLEKLDGKQLFNNLMKMGDFYRFRTFGNNFIILLDLRKIDKHFIYYLVNLLEII